MLVWRVDPFRVPRPAALAGGARVRLLVITGLSLALPEEPWEQFQGVNHVSTFVRSGVTTAYELPPRAGSTSTALTSDRLGAAADETCHLSGKPPNIIMVLDEASFDARAVPGIKLPPGYGAHFRSFDGKTRSLLVEGSGGPTWYTEYNVLTGSVGAVLRPAQLLRHADRRRPRQARPAAGAQALRLQDHLALSGLWRVP